MGEFCRFRGAGTRSRVVKCPSGFSIANEISGLIAVGPVSGRPRAVALGSKTVPPVRFDGIQPRKGEATRERILAVAEASVLAKGFGATSIDEVIAEAGLTKSGFFYHFRDKNELAREMLRRYVASD